MRRFRKIILPIIIIALVAEIIFLVCGIGLYRAYRAAANAELADLVGADLLRAYGYLDADFANPSAEKYGVAMTVAGSVLIFLCALVFVIYFLFYDFRTRRQIDQLIAYLEKLNDRVYDLKIDDNAESEFSRLTNELYKITVTLKESAEYDRRVRHQLETALADISHQLKTPLTSLQIALDNLADPEMSPSVRADFLSASSRQVAAMSSLITTLLDLAKFDSGTIRMSRRVQPIGEILDQVLKNLEILADLKNVRFELSGNLAAKVKLDPHWQAEALSNIVKNCLEFSPSGGVVKISVAQTALYTRITISDHGPGIAPQDLPHIFERFYKAAPVKTVAAPVKTVAAPKNASSSAKTPTVDNSSFAAVQNVGIGLAFAKSVIAADNGQVRAKSALGAGTTFIVTYFSS